jgi:sterol desaturase/sphingolipid hydroxylase (fatty acid hydroxylase superfamily)
VNELWNPARLALGFVILFALFVPLETLFPIVRRQFWQRPGLRADLIHFFVTGGIRKLLTLLVVFGLIQALGFLVYPPLQQSLLALPRWSQFLIAIFIFELGTYWGHRWAHTVPFLWRFHAVHHSSEHLDWAAASRLHPVDQTFIRICGIIPVYLLGFTKETFGFLIAIDGLLAIFIHANVRFRFGPLERLIATPAFHHWHHANEDAATTNKNFSGLLPGFDWLFGTLHLPARYPNRYGIDEPMPDSYLGQLAQPFRSPPTAPAPPVPATAPVGEKSSQ